MFGGPHRNDERKWAEPSGKQMKEHRYIIECFCTDASVSLIGQEREWNLLDHAGFVRDVIDIYPGWRPGRIILRLAPCPLRTRLRLPARART